VQVKDASYVAVLRETKDCGPAVSPLRGHSIARVDRRRGSFLRDMSEQVEWELGSLSRLGPIQS